MNRCGCASVMGGGGVVSGGRTAERGSTGTDFSYLRPCLNGGLAGGGLAGVIRNNISKTVLYNVRKFYDIQFKNIRTNVF